MQIRARQVKSSFRNGAAVAEGTSGIGHKSGVRELVPAVRSSDSDSQWTEKPSARNQSSSVRNRQPRFNRIWLRKLPEEPDQSTEFDWKAWNSGNEKVTIPRRPASFRKSRVRLGPLPGSPRRKFLERMVWHFL